jgi:hypothetical protein
MYTKLKSQINFSRLISLFFLCIVLLLFFVLSKKGLVWGGDSIQYLKMAYKITHLQLPLTDKWMPLYSVLIGIMNVIGFKILTAASIVNLLLIIATVLLIFKLISIITDGDKLSLFLAGLMIVINREFIMNSLTIMGELPLLFFVILFFVYLTKTLKKNKISKHDIYVLTFIVLLSVFTKYNGMILLPVLFYFILFRYEEKKEKIYLFITVLTTIFLPYFVWSKIKSENDILASAIKSNSFLDNISINLKDLAVTLSEFFFIPRVTNLMIDKFSLFQIALVVILFFLIFVFLFVIYFFKNKNGFGAYILVFILTYLSSFIYLTSSTGINEVNTRTLFYPLIFFLIYLIYLFNNIKYFLFRGSIMILIFIFVFFNFLKLNQTSKKFLGEGYGDLNKEYFNIKNQVLENAIKIINRNNFKSHQVFTNKHKVLPIFFDYEIMNELPTNRQWLGNKYWYLDENESKIQIEKIKSILLLNGGSIVYIGNDNKEVFNKYYSVLFNNDKYLKVFFFTDGFIILAKKK